MKTRVFACVAVALLLAGSLATVSGQVQNPRPNQNPGGWDLDLYETVDGTPTGAKTETPPIVLFPAHVAPGWLVLLEAWDPAIIDPQKQDTRPQNWSDLVQFSEVPGLQYSLVQLRSDSEGVPWDSQIVDAVLRSQPTFIQENPTGTPTVYSSFPHHYNIWSDPPLLDIVPEPGQIASGLVVLLFAGGYAGRRAWLCRKGS